MNKNTFGSTPAAMYLASRLDELNDKKFTRKVSKVIHEVQAMMVELREAHSASLLSTHVINFLSFALEDKIEKSASNLMGNHDQEGKAQYISPNVPDQLSVNLMTNLLKGDIKRLRNQARGVTHLEREQTRRKAQTSEGRIRVAGPKGELLGWEKHGFTPVKVQLSSVQEPNKNSTQLINKSVKRLKRLGKKHDFY